MKNDNDDKSVLDGDIINEPTINETEYYNDASKYQPLLQHYTSNILRMIQVNQIRDHVTSAYDDYPIDYEKTEPKNHIYKCERCGYSTKSKIRYNNHLNRKRKCTKNTKIMNKSYDYHTKVILIDSAKYPEDINKYNVCQYCNHEFKNKSDLHTHTCTVKDKLSEVEILKKEKVNLVNFIQKLCTDVSVLRRNHGILLKDNILAHKMIDQYDKLLTKHNVEFNDGDK